MAGSAREIMRGKAKAAILISGRGSNMEALIKSAQDPHSSAEIAIVISNRPEAHGLKVARALGIEAVCIDHRSFSSKEDFEEALDRQCRSRGSEIILCAGFMRLLTADFAERWRGRLINIHPSLLPCYPGLRTHERALEDQVRIHGCTVHFVTADVDKGPIIAQGAVPVMPDDSAKTLAQRVLEQEHRLYPMVLEWLAAGLVKLEGERVVYGFAPARDEAGIMVPRRAMTP
jgi:phosphoribosylglycinamide formyltransferase-1